MQSDNASKDRRNEKQTLINALWESLFGGQCKKHPSKKVAINHNRRLYMVGLEDFPLDNCDDKLANLVNQTKNPDQIANRKHKGLPDSDKQSPEYSKSPSSKVTERKYKNRNEKIDNKGDERHLKHVPRDYPTLLLDKDVNRSKKDKKNAGNVRDVKKEDIKMFFGEELEQHSKVSFNLNHLPEDSEKRSEIIAHVIERVDSLKKRMKDEKLKLNSNKKPKTIHRTTKSSSDGNTDESSSVKTLYWPRNESVPVEDPVVCQFNALTEVLNNYIDPKRHRLDRLVKNKNKKTETDVYKKSEKQDDERKPEKPELENVKHNRIEHKNTEECKTTSKDDGECGNRKLEIEKQQLTQIELKQKSICKLKSQSTIDTNRVENFINSGLPSSEQKDIVNEIECDNGKVKSDKIDDDAKEQVPKGTQMLDTPPKDVENKGDLDVFSIEIQNDGTNTLFIMENNLCNETAIKKSKEVANHFSARDGSGERDFIHLDYFPHQGIVKSSCERDTPIGDDYNEIKQDVSIELEQNNFFNATNVTTSKSIQTFIESQKSAILKVTYPLTGTQLIDQPVKNNSLIISLEKDTKELKEENYLASETSDDFHEKQCERITYLVPILSRNEPTIVEDLITDIFKKSNYIPASQRKLELKDKYASRLVSLSFYMQVASCYQIVAQFDKLLFCETLANQENNVPKKRNVHFEQHPELEQYPEFEEYIEFEEYPEFESILPVQGDSNLSEDEKLNIEMHDDIQDEQELCCLNYTIEQKLEEIESRVEKYSEKVQICSLEDDKTKPTASPSTIPNPIYVVIMNAKEENLSSFSKAEICKIESNRFSEIVLNEINGANKKLIVESEVPKTPEKEKKGNDNLESKNNPICVDKCKGSLIPSKSKEKISKSIVDGKIKPLVPSVRLPSVLNKFHAKRNSYLPRVKLDKSNIVIAKSQQQKSKPDSQSVVSKQCRDTKNAEVLPKSRIVKDERKSSPGKMRCAGVNTELPESWSSQLMTIRDEIRELKNLFAKR